MIVCSHIPVLLHPHSHYLYRPLHLCLHRLCWRLRLGQSQEGNFFTSPGVEVALATNPLHARLDADSLMSNLNDNFIVKSPGLELILTFSLLTCRSMSTW